MLKRISHLVHPHEKETSVLLSSEPLRSHPGNHCVPLYEVLDLPEDENISILVLPFLRSYNETVGEVVECFRQVIEGLQFMHQCRAAHRDCMMLNITMDPKSMFPQFYHPMATMWNRTFTSPAKRPYTRTARPPKHYLIDFDCPIISELSILRTLSQPTLTTLEMLSSRTFWRDPLDLSFSNCLLTTWCRAI